MVVVLMVGCTSSRHDVVDASVPFKTLPNGAHQLLINGLNRHEVRELYGKPHEVLTADFRDPLLGCPDNVRPQTPKPDEQWVYRTVWDPGLTWSDRIVCFRNGKVVFAREEGSNR